MTGSGPEGGERIGRERRLERWLAGALLVWLGLAHMRAVAEAPLVRYGYRGAEYLEHIQRQYAIALTAGQSWWERLWKMPDALALLDGQYPALLHVISAGWGCLAGNEVAGTLYLNLLFLGILAVGTGWTAYRLHEWQRAGRAPGGMGPGRAEPGGAERVRAEPGGKGPGRAEPGGAERAGREKGRDVVLLAVVAVLVMPAVFATARRYYYDLPLAAWCAVATAGLLRAHRSGRSAFVAGVATAAACLTKWQALLYLAPAWMWALGAGLSAASGAGSGAGASAGAGAGSGAGSGAGPGEGWGAGLGAADTAVRPGRRRVAAIARLGAAFFLAMLLCGPVARRSDVLARWISESLGERVAVWLELSIQHRQGSLDDALGQGARAFAGSGGVIERLSFYARAFLESSVGPWLAGMLAAAALLGRQWRVLAFALWLVVPPVLLLAVGVRVEDERFLLPILPALASAAAVGWAGIRSQRVARALWHLTLAAGLIQMLAVDDLIPAALGPRSPVQMRGWNRRHEAPPSPWQSYLTLARAACPAEHPPTAVLLADGLSGVEADLHAWRWALLRACPNVEVRTDMAKPDPAQACLSLLSTEHLDEPGSSEVISAIIPGGSPERIWLYRRGRCR